MQRRAHPRPDNKRPPKGRPPLPAHAKRSYVLEVALNDSERARVEEQAQRRGLAPSAYLRDRGLGRRLPRAASVGSLDPDRIDALNKLWLAASALRRDLAPLANNLNQLTHYAHSGRFQEQSLLSLLSEVSPLVERCRRLEEQAAMLLAAVVQGDKP